MDKKPKNSVGEDPNGSHNAPASSSESPKTGPVDVPGLLDLVLEEEKRRTANQGADTTMDRFFGTRERTFWTFQAMGWTGYGLVRSFTAFAIGFDLRFYSILILVAIVLGLTMTTALRYLYRYARDWSLPLLLPLVVTVCAALGLLYSYIEVSLGPVLIPNFSQASGLGLFSNAMFEATTLFAWSAIYFGYHFYTGMQEQKEQALKATAMAHQAQLKMLRYQLNPHFLFNTLNAISTLVLEKSEEDANKMLTKLSSFLRFTLVNQPTQRIPLDQELHALGLYLEIEKVRFSDRLNVEFDIDEQARSALIPSLILQPLIENAIKYAIAPEIDGGTISVSATVKNHRLTVSLKDSGPGIEDLNNIVSQSGSGVGITNTKERLQQIYGDDHRITLENLEPQGLGIFIEIPCERQKRP
ncbi:MULTISPECIES: sensor histidine kinase [Kordiimonas]|jgi:signal transduction histidine kinase|uniref:sensor histidine kinase n=1 Tax=Kordiimonas TaxID=288021 RepID=UPI00257BFD2A|nr:histidine kinase [Kordiimonas sp. UBA4487]